MLELVLESSEGPCALWREGGQRLLHERAQPELDTERSQASGYASPPDP